MEKEIRIFVAVRIETGENLREQFRRLKKLFSDDRINWVPEDNFHLTLRFIGNTNQQKLESLQTRLKEYVAGIAPFNLTLRGVGYFKSKGSPRVVFTKIVESEKLLELAKSVELAVVATGFQEELKPFRPHLTLGRIKHLNNLNRFLSIVDEIPEETFQKVPVSEVILYQSILRPEGPQYKPIKKFQLL